MLVLKEGFQKGLNLDQMKLIAQPRYSALRMQILEEGMEFGELLLWNESFDALQLEQILEGRQNGLNHAQVKSYADPFFSNFQILEIRKGIENGLSEEKIALYRDNRYSDCQMRQIRIALEEKMSIEAILKFADPSLDWQDMKKIRNLERKKL